MKNIHIISTENSSRLSYNKDGVLELHRLQWRKNTQHIYITNGEEIKEGDYILIHGHYKHGKHITKVVKITDTYEVIEGGNHSKKACQRIILTTDQDLIKNGVQAIDDEFLEWFVKNPSCEYVEVSEDYFKPSNMVYGHDTEPYKIIIPKEEPKQYPKTFKELFANTGIEPITDESGNIQYNFKATMKEETKQETLEESLKKELEFTHDSIRNMDFDLGFKTGSLIGAKWQQEQDKKLYSVEDMKEAFYEGWILRGSGASFRDALEEWLEKFKKK